MKKPVTSHTNKTERTVIKNATSNIFFVNESHHKHTVDFKESKTAPLNVITSNEEENNMEEENVIENPIVNKFFNIENTSSYNIKTPSQINPLTIYGVNYINLEEYKALLSNLFEFITLLYSKTLSCLIPKIEKDVPVIRKYTVLDNTANLLTVINQKNRKIELLLDMIKKRVKYLTELNLHYNIIKLFKGKLQIELDILMSIELKFLISLWVVIVKLEDDEKIISEVQNFVLELYQAYLYLTQIILNKIKDSYKGSLAYYLHSLSNA